MTKKTTKMRLIIDVTYQNHGEPVEVLHALLCNAAEHLADNGLLSGESDAAVTCCTHWTEDVTKTKGL